MNAVIVEDDPVTASVIKELLEKKFSAYVEKAKDCSSCRNILPKRTWDIAILDYQLPDGDGLSLMEEITSIDDHPAVIMVTGRGSEYVASQAIKMGASAYLQKDKDLTAVLTEAVAKALAEVTSRRTSAARELERQRLLSIFESIDEPAYVIDPETYEILYTNGAMKKMFGEIIGSKCYESMQGMDSPCPFCFKDKILGENIGRTHIEDFQNRLNQRWYHCIDKAIEWPDGRLVCYEIAVDITEQKLAEQALHEERTLTESALNVMDDLLFMTDLKGEPLRWNRRVNEVTGYSDKELSTMNPFNLIKKEDVHMVDEGIERVRKTGGNFEEVEILTKDGRLIPFEFNGTLICDHDGNPTGICAVGRDLTERQEADKALRESEETYRSLVLANPDAVTAINLEGIFTYVSDRTVEVHGFESAEELLGKSAFELIAPEDHEKAMKSIEKAFTESPVMGVEFTMLRKDGSRFTGEMSAALIRDSEGRPKTLIGITRDITERKITEKLLRESEETYRSLVLSSPDAVIATDLDGNITYVSERALELYGVGSAEELIGKNAFEIISPEDHERARENLIKTLEEPLRKVEYTMLSKDGSTYTGELNAALIRDSVGNPKAFISTVSDITERKRAEEQLLELNRELEGYTHAVSHDLRGPLSAIMAANMTLQYMLKNPVPEDVDTSIDELAEIINKNLEVSSALVEDLLVLAEAGQVPREVHAVDVGAVVQRILDERAYVIAEKGVKIDVDDDLGRVTANPTHIYQLFSNLIANAIKHNASKKPRVRVSYLGDSEKGGHRYLLKDNGSGIPVEHMDQIFVPFFKGETGETGIGLAIVAKIVGIYGGTVEAYNDRGACFEFTLMDAA